MDEKRLKIILAKLMENTQEVKVLYEMNEAEFILFTSFMAQLPIGEMSPALASKMCRAAGHFFERCEEIVLEMKGSGKVH
jgi:hypothetical protein